MLMAGRQCHELPDESGERETIASGLGLSWKKFQEKLNRVREENRTLFETLFPPAHLDAQTHWLVEVIQTGKPTDELKNLFGKNAAAMAQALKSYQVKTNAGARYSEEVYQALSRSADLFITQIQSSRDPVLLLNRFHRFESLVASRVAFWQLVGEQEHSRTALMTLAARSGHACRTLQAHPEWLDLTLQAPTPNWREAQLQALTLSPTSLARLTYGVVAHFVLGGLKRAELEHLLTGAADAILTQACAATRTQGLCIVAMGKWGQGALLPGSDLDLVFFTASKGKVLDTQEKSAQKLINLITDFTDEGYLYEADARLRPHGQQGALVFPLADALAYYRQADPWEQLLFLGARCVEGNGKPFDELRHNVLSLIDPTDALGAGLKDIMRRVFLEMDAGKPGKRLDLKNAPGGLLHLETTATFLAMKHRLWEEHPALSAETIFKLTEPDLHHLYTALRNTMLWQRIAGDLPVSNLTLGSEAFTAISAALEQETQPLFDQLLQTLEKSRALCEALGV
jgi:glutamate-ammonia-ligase adenylyltransferase